MFKIIKKWQWSNLVVRHTGMSNRHLMSITMVGNWRGMMSMPSMPVANGVAVVRRHLMAVPLMPVSSDQMAVLAVSVVGVLVRRAVLIVSVARLPDYAMLPVVIGVPVGGAVRLVGAAVCLGRQFLVESVVLLIPVAPVPRVHAVVIPVAGLPVVPAVARLCPVVVVLLDALVAVGGVSVGVATAC